VLDGELHDPRSECGQHLSERRAGQRRLRVAEAEPVEKVERFDPQLEPLRRPYRESADERAVQAPVARTPEAVAREAAERAGRGLRESDRVYEVLGGAVAVDIVEHLVWPLG